MANANVAQDSAPVGSTPEDLEAIFQSLMDSEAMISQEVHEGLRDLADSADLTVRPWKFMAYVASQGGNFFQGISDDAHTARLMAPMSKILEEFSDRMKLVSDLSSKAALRIRLAGCSHPEFNTWREDSTEGGVEL